MPNGRWDNSRTITIAVLSLLTVQLRTTHNYQ